MTRLGFFSLALAVVSAGSVASAAPPSNDAFASATAVTALPYTDGPVSNAEATLEPGEPSPSCVNRHEGHTIWYAFTPATAGDVVADTRASDVDTVLAAYTGSALGSLTEIACDDDGVGLQSVVVLPVAADTTYYFQVDGYFGSGDIRFNLDAALRPSNDDRADAEPIAVDGSDAEVTFVATVEQDEPEPSCVDGQTDKTIWYAFTPEATDLTPVVVSLLDSDFDTTLAVYEISPAGGLTEVACNDDAGGTRVSRAVFQPSPQTTYLIQAGGFNGASGTLRIAIEACLLPSVALCNLLGGLPPLSA